MIGVIRFIFLSDTITPESRDYFFFEVWQLLTVWGHLVMRILDWKEQLCEWQQYIFFFYRARIMSITCLQMFLQMYRLKWQRNFKISRLTTAKFAGFVFPCAHRTKLGQKKFACSLSCHQESAVRRGSECLGGGDADRRDDKTYVLFFLAGNYLRKVREDG